MNRYGYVYHTYCKASGKHYIGQHAGSKFDSLYLGSGKVLRRALLKYGEDAFEVTPIKWVTSREELDLEEIWQIARFTKSYGKRMMYNLSKGGTGGAQVFTPAYRLKISLANRGQIPWNKGRHYKIGPLSGEHRQKLSDAQSGKPKSEDFKARLRITMRGRKPWNAGKCTGQVPWNKGSRGGTSWNKGLKCPQCRHPAWNQGLRTPLRTKKLLSAARLGKTHSDDTKKKCGEASSAYWRGRRAIENAPI